MSDAPRTGYQIMPVDLIQESAANPRTNFDPAALDELSDSIRSQGVMVPLLVRPVGEHFEIVDGARRLRAAQAAGLHQVPVVIQAREDDGAREAALVANLQRADVAPLDEARAFRGLLEATGSTVTDVNAAQHIAERVGKTPKYVWDRLKLLDLVPVGQQLLDADRLTVHHATILARLTAEQQTRAIREGTFEREAALSLYEDTALEDVEDIDDVDDRALAVGHFTGRKARTVRELEAWIARYIRFDAHQAAAAAPLDFGPLEARVTEAAAQPGRGRKVVHITYDSYVQPDAKADGERTFCRQSWKRADGADEESPTCDRSVLGLVVVGPCYGQAFQVCVNKDCDVHWAAEKRAREKLAKGRAKGEKSGAARADADRKWKEQQAREEQERKAWSKAAPAIAQAVAAAVQKAKPMALAASLVERANRQDGKELDKLLGACKTTDDVIRRLALASYLDQIHNSYWGPREFPKVARTLGVDVPAIVKTANAPAVEAPPKSPNGAKPAKAGKPPAKNGKGKKR